METEFPAIGDNLGGALRERRVRDHLSLRALAERTGFSPSFLSQVENGQSCPSLSSIKKITAALNIPLGQFFNSLDGPRVEPRRELDLNQWRSQWSRAEVTQLGMPNDEASLTAFIVTFEAGGSSGYPHSSPFEEFAYVLDGEVKVTVDAEQRHLLAGNGLTLDAGQRRCWLNSGSQRARVLIILNVASRQNNNIGIDNSRPIEAERRSLAG